jgi:DNA-directed RNA polymerase specialized sigma24 family protein
LLRLLTDVSSSCTSIGSSARRRTAEDLLQETLLAAWRGLEQFEGRASVRAWLYRIATNRALDKERLLVALIGRLLNQTCVRRIRQLHRTLA